MAYMYDSATDQIPADAQEILVYTDGAFANDLELKARFPNAKIHTISAVGKNLGEFIDCEPGAVWPVAKAVQVFRVWGPQGCKGFYCSMSTRPLLETALRAVQIDPASVEWFEADPTGIAHIRNGDVATQYLWAGVYDESETSDVLDPPPNPPPSRKQVHMLVAQFGQQGQPGSGIRLVREAGTPVPIDPPDIAAWLAACGQTAPAGPFTLTQLQAFS